MATISAPPVSSSIFQYPPFFPNGEVAAAWQAWFHEVQNNVNGFVTTADLSAVTSSLAASSGAGMVGFSNADSYASGTIGAKASSIPDVANGSLYALKRALATGDTCGIQILTDSTGNDTTDWPYILGQRIAASYPGFTVDHMLWSDATQTYAAPTRLQLGTAGGRYLDCANGTYAAILDPATSVGPTTSTTIIDVRVKCSLSSWTPAAQQYLVMLDKGAAPYIGWRFYVSTNGKLGFLWSTDGTAAFSEASTVATGFAADAIRWVRCLFQPNDGGGNRVTKFYTSTDGATWTQLGTTVTTAGATSVYNPLPTYGYQLGGVNSGPAIYTKLYAVDVRDGDTGPSIIPILPDLWSPASLGTPQPIVGAPVLTIVNGAHPGANIAYLGNATRLPKMVPQYGQVVTFLSDSHNEGWITSSSWGTLLKTWVDQVRTKLPGSGICLMTQNPETTGALLNRVHSIRRYNILALKSAGYDVLDIWQQFIDAGFPGSLMTDSVHPNLAGSTLWASYVKRRIDKAIG